MVPAGNKCLPSVNHTTKTIHQHHHHHHNNNNNNNNNQKEEESHYKSLRVKKFWRNNYFEYKSNGDKNRILPVE